ncbi:GTP cyclohydrolase I [Vibrio phage 2.117.O._10N.261.45.E9]|nr:GTP cyclohydrolase I [Vibrio phage 1.117.O._10N.261.45.E9]AUR95457.1 GTP cyclohydrolase I [Vibrio phage 1.207.B._10N.222.51.C2]AUS02348.1 GTP cyclohydrolase I [Vibrio phage 2.117.O._10N.261.45.E9]
MDKHYLSNKDVSKLAEKLANCCEFHMAKKVFGIQRGGIPAAHAVAAAYARNTEGGLLEVVDNPEDADVFIDDIIDSGATMTRYCEAYPEKPFFALVDKLNGEMADQWVVFPWEVKEDGDAETAEDNVRRLIQFIGEDPNREGLLETPSRVIKAWQHWFKGYHQDPQSLLKVFSDGAERADEMVVVKDIQFFSHCEHHIAPIFGTATVAYIPNGKIVGLSKITRLVDCIARRLQVQERLTDQVAEELVKGLAPLGVAVQIRARHMCVESRGVSSFGQETITNSLHGVFKSQPETRAEFMAIAKSNKAI